MHFTFAQAGFDLETNTFYLSDIKINVCLLLVDKMQNCFSWFKLKDVYPTVSNTAFIRIVFVNTISCCSFACCNEFSNP